MKMSCIYLWGRSVKGGAIFFFFFLEFCFAYYTVIYVIYFFCLSLSCIFVILYSIMILLNFIEFHEEQLTSPKFQHSEQYAIEVQAIDTPLFHWRFSVVSPEAYSLSPMSVSVLL